MKTKLKKMKLTSVDLVNRGANPKADICIYKSDTPPEYSEIDTDSLAEKIVKSIKQLFHKSSYDNSPDNTPEAEEITKSDVIGEVTGCCNHLVDSLTSIIESPDIEAVEKTAEFQKSISEFSSFMKSAAETWTGCKSIQSANVDEMLNNAVEVAKKETEKEGVKKMALTAEELMIYKALQAKMSPEDVAKANNTKPMVPVDEMDEEDDMPPVEGANGKTEKACGTKTQKACGTKTEKACGTKTEKACGTKTQKACNPDVNKSEIPDFVKDAIAKSEAFMAKFELKEMTEIAKKYEPLGQKTDELAKQLVELKKSNEAMYNTCIAMMDNQLEMIEKSGLFTEVGKSGVQGDNGDVVTKAEGMAAEIRKSNPTLTYEQSMAQVWDAHPELMEEYSN